MLANQSSVFEIRPIRSDEVHAAAALHFEHFGGPEVARWSMLKLGLNFLENAFYRLNLDNPHFFALGAFVEGRLVGLQVFATDRGRMFRHLVRKHGFKLLYELLIACLQHPLVAGRLIWNKVFVKADIPSEIYNVRAVLLLMLVCPEARTKSFMAKTGIWTGGALVEAMETIMWGKGCREYWSETTLDNNTVQNLARRLGARCVGEAHRQGVLLRFILAPVRTRRQT